MARNQKQNDKALTLKRRLLAHTNPKDPVVEQYRTIRTNIQFSSVENSIRSLVLTSSGPGEGKSTTSSNLGIVYAQQGKKVLLIDADLRKPTAHYTFRTENFIGLTNVLTKQSDVSSAIKKTEVPNLFLMTSGPIPPNPSELLASSSMNEMLDQLYKEFDFIILDTPPALAVTDAQVLANFADASILVISSGKTEKAVARKAIELLQKAKAKLLGAVLNNRKIEDGGHYYYYGNN